MRLVTRLILAFLLVVLLLGGIGLWTGSRLISRAVFDEAQYRTELDLRGGRAILEDRLEQVQRVLENAANRSFIKGLFNGGDKMAARLLLERDRVRNGLDVLSIVNAKGDVIMRTRRPYNVGDSRAGDPLVAKALSGEAAGGFVLLYPQELEVEDPWLADRARIDVKPTPRARPRGKEVQTSGMMLWSAVPLTDENGGRLGAIYGGVLLNRDESIISDVRDVVFGPDQYEGKDLGTVTIFLDDVRIATNVRDADGNLAIGTQVSATVYERVVESNRPFYNRAFVVNDWYLSAYEPIRSPAGDTIGILYVGVLEAKYADTRNRIRGSFIGPVAGGIALSVLLGLVLARMIARPVRELDVAACKLAEGDLDYRPRRYRSSPEIVRLGESFRTMSDAISERDMKLREQNVELEEGNVRLTQLNGAYMDMLGFVSHELKNPLNSMIFGATSLRDEYVGPLNAEQKKIMATVLRNAEYLEEMIAHYLDLSRIEKDELEVRRRNLVLDQEILEPAVSQMRSQIDAAKMVLRKKVDESIEVSADPTLLREVVDNLLSNAVKYGREGGLIELKAVRFEPGHEKEILISVWNEGEGILPENMDKLFGKFVRLRQPGARHRKGTGLGLFISRKIVESHGGRIWAESAPGEWVRFTVALPRTDASEKE
ncbi:MAG: Adaptive-response sensory-kinase SasA [Phycisphaerae bacterium]|nr:Adaptive-response sensory-kinase SasA [Phycisphaerae bacterium]